MLKKAYINHLKDAEKVFEDEAETKMKNAASRLVQIVSDEEPDKTSIGTDGQRVAEVAVTVDGTWQKEATPREWGLFFSCL